MALSADTPFRRALVIGSSGVGKSTFARKLATLKGFPVIHLDQLYWEPGWVIARPEVYRVRLERALAADTWVMDGNNSSTLDLRLPRADAVIWLDRPRWVCLARVLRRIAGSYGHVREDVAPGCPEQIDLECLRYVWTFHRKHYPRMTAALARHDALPRTAVLRSDREAQAFLDAAAVV
ncbi:MAG: topology modulation protein [Sphingomonadales bacterium]|nr:topology modulation protein [Sphingomonadales bacterium]